VEVISRVPTVLHTPLMSGANAIHGIVLIGGVILLGTSGDNCALFTLGFIAVILGTLNVVGGFVVTDRMLEMFKAKKADKTGEEK
jgi:NAD(P) transhydrogenase subunit alpha